MHAPDARASWLDVQSDTAIRGGSSPIARGAGELMAQQGPET